MIMKDKMSRINQKEKKKVLMSCIFNKRGQMKMQEMMFVLLAIALLASLVFIFVIRFQSGSFKSEIEAVNQKRALSLRDKIATLPELKCARISCIDKDKARILKDHDLDDLFQGLTSARIFTLYPGDEEIILYESGKPTQRSYSTYVNLCEQKSIGSVFEYDCALALLLVGI